MKRIFLLLSITAALLFASCNLQNQSVEAQTAAKTSIDDKPVSVKKTPVLVELFTSEGCSSCPPADKLLVRLEQEQAFKDVEIITLSLHVDYWDRLGWKDEFSSAMFSRRQDIYAQVFRIGQTYTPQMVVDGRSHFIGSRPDEAKNAIISNSKNPKADIELSFGKDILNVNISSIPKHNKTTVYLAISEDNLATDVKRGENSGKKLEHSSVVRELRSLGMLSAEQSAYKYEQAIQLLPNWKRENLKFIVFLQDNQTREILGASRIKAF